MRARLGGVVWLVAVVEWIVAQVVVAAAWPTPYSLRENVISDLGNTACAMFAVPRGRPYAVCSPLHGVMNGAFVAAGVLIVLALVLLGRWWPTGRAAAVSWWLWVLVGVGKVVVGFSPENVDLGLHILGALNLPFSALGVLLFAVAVGRRWPGLAAVSAVLGLVGLAGFVLLGLDSSPAGPHLGAGLVERVASYPAELWSAIVAVLALGGVSVTPARVVVGQGAS